MRQEQGNGMERGAGISKLKALAVLCAIALPIAAHLVPAPAHGGAGGNISAAVAVLFAATGVAHGVTFAILLVLFGATLLPGRTALATRLAERIDPWYHPGMRAYTRGVTAAWCGFFAAQLATSALLLALAPAGWWSFFVGVLDWPLVVAMFLGEYLVRRLRFRNQRHVSLVQMLRAGPRSLAALGR